MRRETRGELKGTVSVEHRALAGGRIRTLGALVLIALGTPHRAGAQADVPLGVRRAIGAPSRPLRAVGDAARRTLALLDVVSAETRDGDIVSRGSTGSSCGAPVSASPAW